MSPDSTPERPRALAWTLVVAVGLSALVRLAAARGDLGPDEVWATHLAGQAGAAGSPVGALGTATSPLVLGWLVLVGPGAAPWLARLASVLSGAALVAVGAFWSRRRSPVERLASAVLLAFSGLLVDCGSEVSGAAPASLLSVASFAALDGWVHARRALLALAFALAALLAPLSHLAAIFPVAACGVYAAVAVLLARREERPPRWHLALVALPLLGAAGLAFLAWRTGGPAHSPAGGLQALRETIASALGLPLGVLEVLAAGPLLLALFDLVRLLRGRDLRLAFHLTLAALVAAWVVWPTPRAPAVRDLAVVAPFLLLLAAAGLDGLTNLGRRGLATVGALLLLFLAVNAFPVARLLRLGRGAPGDAIATMLQETSGAVTVGSDRDEATRLVVEDLARRLGATGRIAYLPADAHRGDAPDWLIASSDGPDRTPPPVVQGRNGRSYILLARFPHAGLGGVTWSLYRMAVAAAREE